MGTVQTPALVLRKFLFGETSQVLHLLTRDRGRVHALAKGSCREKSAFGGPLDLLELGDARIYARRDGLSILGGFERKTAFPAIRRVRPRLEAAFGVLEILSAASREDHADEALFNLGLDTLHALEGAEGERAPVILLRFDLRVLDVLGVSPVLEACVLCGGELRGSGRPLLSPAKGGVLCGGCGGEDPMALFATRGIAAALAHLQDPEGPIGPRLALSARDRALARRLVDGLLRHALEREIRGGRKGRRGA